MLSKNNNRNLMLKVKQSLIASLIKCIQTNDNLIKIVEYTRGLYRYPNMMIGRKHSIYNKSQNTDILVFAAHPDDDVLGLGTILYRHSLKGDNIKVVFVTNGTGRDGESWSIKAKTAKGKFETRYHEAVKALSLINIPPEDIHFLGFPDGGTQRYLKNISEDIKTLIQKLTPGRIYVHCIEGGHGDHDLTSYVVKSVCKKMGYTDVYEWTEYNPMQPLGTQEVRFLSNYNGISKEIKIDISEEERKLKRKMLANHKSQDVEQFFLQGEAIRRVDISRFDKELLEYCQIAKRRLLSKVKRYDKFIGQIRRNTYSYHISENKRENI